ncbi:MAG TPA: iron donor protein CyaY [Myxococcaceae bacterium]|nr:iron donor protein CyaY [Myxococcaceae bacterium]
MDETRYNQLVASAFQRLLQALDRVDPDLLDADSTGDMVTITSASGQKVVVNTQRAARQIWVAGKGIGVHFSYQDDGRWMDDKARGLELFAFVADAVEAAAGVRLEFTS